MNSISTGHSASTQSPGGDQVIDHLLRALGFGPLLGIGGDYFRTMIRRALSVQEPPGAWPEARSYPLRSSYPSVLLSPNPITDDASLRALVPELLASQVNLFAVRLERGKPLNPNTIWRLSKVVEHLQTELNFVNVDTRRIKAVLATGSIPQPEERWQRGRSLRPGLPRGEGPELLAQIASGGNNWRKLVERLFTRFFDRSAGLFILDDIDQQPKRYLADPVAIEALIMLAHTLVISVSAPQDHVVIPLPPKTGGLLGVLNVLSTVPELPRGLSRHPPDPLRAILTVEAEQRIETAALETFGVSLRILPAPPWAPFVLSLRRDVDRPLGSEEMARHLAWQKTHGFQATWFFKPETYCREVAYIAAGSGDEIGWHVCHVENGDHGFLDRLRAEVNAPIFGTTNHGGQDASLWQGRRTISTLASLQLTYGERLTEWVPHPEVDRDTGLVLTQRPLPVESPPYWADSHEQLIRRYRGHLIVANHPDLFSPALEERLDAWRAEGAVVRRLCDHVAAVRSTYHTSGTVAPEGTGRHLTITSAGRCFMEIKIPSKSPFKASVDVLPDAGSDNELDRYVIDMDQAQTVSLTL